MIPGQATKISYRKWDSARTRAVILLIHGLGAHTGRWEAMAEFFRDKGVTSYAAEFGDVDKPDALAYRSGHFKNYFKGIESIHNSIKKDYPSSPIFLAGESMGALISFLFAASNPGLFNGLICISPAFENRYRVTFRDFFRMFTPLLYNPEKTHHVPFDSSLCTRDGDYINRMKEDPGEHRLITSKLILELLLAEMYARLIKQEIKIPMLFLIAGEDKIVDIWASKRVFERTIAGDKRLVEFPGMYHALSIDIGKEKVFEEISDWMERRIS